MSTNYTFIQTWSDEAKKVLCELMEQSFAKPFIEPVDVEQYPVSTISLVMVNPNRNQPCDSHSFINLKDYTEYIKHPLCLRDMEKKLGNGEYQTGCAFFDDFKQIVANSRIYNTDMSSEVRPM